MKKYVYLLTAFLLWFPGMLGAQELLTLEEAVRISLENNYDIKLTKNAAAISKNNVNPANAGMLPVLTGDMNTGGSRQNTRQTPATGADRVITGARSTNFAYGVNLGWTIFDGFSMFAAYDRLKELEKQGQVNARATVIANIADVISTYYDIVRQEQLLNAADSTLDVSRMRQRIADNKLQLGRGSKLDVLAASVDYNADTSAYLQQKTALANTKVRLNQLLARDLQTRFEVKEQIEIDGTLTYPALEALTEQQNPDIRNAFINKRIAELTLKEVRGQRYPTIAINGGYERSRSTSPTGFNQRFQANGFTYGLTAGLNIFNGFLQRQNERNAKIEISSASLSLEKARQDVKSLLLSAYQNYQNFIELVKLERRNVDIARQNLDITLEKYRLGSIPPLELREAQKNSLDAVSRFVEIEYQAKIAEITLREISGSLDIQ
ncbi:transporter [Pedobacter yulinensis]|uniref:Transporter n=1 Tax=Pedobacter yulinensis TaxID=2126353 RepID=A0A2T3HPI3_9SPHI|nr:TolC family protein [Pedobacter yulinensis]PST84354.1 transporter [Pedobacter yulinensis]